jgi:hypothetical protein
MRGTRDGPVALAILEAALRGTVTEAREDSAGDGAIVRGAIFGGACRGAEKCNFGAGRVSERHVNKVKTRARQAHLVH